MWISSIEHAGILPSSTEKIRPVAAQVVKSPVSDKVREVLMNKNEKSRRGFDPLVYRFQNEAPEPGKVTQVAEGVFWARLPLWGRLNHINVWLLKDYDGWTVVDTGIHTDAVKAIWEALFVEVLKGQPITRVIATHLHTDHTGNAGWLAQKFDCPLWMSRSDFYMCKVMAFDQPKDVPEDAIRFYQRAGFDESRLNRYRERFGQFGASISALPAGYQRIQDGQYIDINGREWRALIGKGHAPEHVCLYCPELKVLISGDQILPRITPNVSVQPSEPDANPLREWIQSCIHFREVLPPNLMVLPAHQELFEGVHERLTALVDWHEVALENLYDLCQTPKRAVDVFPAIFKSTITDMSFFPATGEAIAHLHCARERRMLISEPDDAGVLWWRQA